MNIHVLQHVEFEDSGYILEWGNKHSHTFSYSRLYQKPEFPQMEDFDLLLIMGGPMNIYEHEKYSWLKKEKQFILQSIESGKMVLGICLGAQLIADVLGAKVSRGQQKEIGWFNVVLSDTAKHSTLFKNFPHEFTAFHWHGDTFETPEQASHIASSIACFNQAFEYKNRVAGLQFHLEATSESINKLLVNCADELTEGSFIQSSAVIKSSNCTASANKLMEILLTNMEALYSV